MEKLKARLDEITERMADEKGKQKQLMRDYIQKYGEIDWTEEPFKVETTFYGEGYYTAEVERVWIDKEEDELVIDTDLGEMNLIGIPVPPGFTITTDVCSEYYAQGKEKVIEMLRRNINTLF